MGHSMQAVGLLVHAAKSVFCVPPAARIHEGLVWSNRDKRTLLDKMLGLLDILTLKAPFYFVAVAYYAAGKMVSGLLKQGNHLVTRVKSNAVAYAPAPRKKGRRTRGRPKTYGKKAKPKSLLGRLPKSCQTQNACLSGLHPGRIWCPGTAPVSCRRCTQACLGLLRILAANHSPGIPPSEFVVANALRQSLPEFLLGPAKSDSLANFIADRQDTQNMRIFRLAS